MTVREYTTKFERLSRLAYHMVDTPAKKNHKYLQGLNLSLRKLTVSSISQSFEDLVCLAMELEGLRNENQGKPVAHPMHLDKGTSTLKE